jgi:C4-dicarboxylate transporter, DctQ subunit
MLWILNKISTALGWLGFVSVLILVLLIGQDVFRRYVLNSPAGWTLEVSMGIQLLFGFLCAGYVLREGGHIRMEILTERIRPKLRSWLFLIDSILGFCLSGVLAYYAWLMTAASYVMGSLTPMLQYPLWWLKLVIVIGFILLALQFIAETWKYSRQIKHPSTSQN